MLSTLHTLYEKNDTLAPSFIHCGLLGCTSKSATLPSPHLYTPPWEHGQTLIRFAVSLGNTDGSHISYWLLYKSQTRNVKKWKFLKRTNYYKQERYFLYTTAVAAPSNDNCLHRINLSISPRTKGSVSAQSFL